MGPAASDRVFARDMRRRSSDAFTNLRLVKYLLLGSVLLLTLYTWSSFSPSLPRLNRHAVNDGRLRESSTSGQPQSQLQSLWLKSVPICDMRLSELIPCLDRNLIYQMRLKLNLSLMEHYERHCPLPQRRFNCLLPPPNGYKVCLFLTFCVLAK